ncbi:hypothetical protein AaE_015975 [Aphanomyces astaci]|uniref:Uncharacterized protein n=1 Tax=Aphanomyces astaci TaxID=112090 RepID=A0A6A4Z553_APHAT|nr:hypothetical protein AaE_015975 [Aphanomyces astaci]
MEASLVRVHRSYADKQSILEAWAASTDISQVEFSRRHDIPLSTIQKWLGNAQKINAVDATKTMKHNMTKKRMIGDNKQVRKLDQKSQTLFAWIVSAPDPLDMASVRAQARGIWPEWLDKSQSAWKCGDNFRKWCTRFVQRHFPEKFNNRLRLTSADASHTMPCGAGALSNPAASTNPAERVAIHQSFVCIQLCLGTLVRGW